MKHPFIIPEQINPVDLGSLLIPRETDPGHRGMRPKTIMATYQVSKAFINLKPQPAEETIITEHCSDTFQEDPIPIPYCPAQTSAKGSGQWLMERRGHSLYLNAPASRVIYLAKSNGMKNKGIITLCSETP